MKMKVQLRAVPMALAIAVSGSLGMSHAAFAGDVQGLTLKTVTFGTGALDIKKDDAPQSNFETPHYDASREKQSPFGAQTYNNHLSAKATFSVLPLNAELPIKVRATGTYFTFPEQDCTPSNGQIIYGDVLADEYSFGFPGSVSKTDDFSLTWEFSCDDGVTWQTAGTSKNKVYVSLAGATGLETVVDIACRNALGCNAPDITFEGIWGDFDSSGKSGTGVKRADEQPMGYYSPSMDNGQPSMEVLVATRNGHCEAWQQLMVRTLALQNVSCSLVNASPKKRPGLTPQSIKCKPAPAQRNNSAPTTYNFHTIVRSNIVSPNALYDPSYGGSYAGPSPDKLWEESVIQQTMHTDNTTGDSVIIPNLISTEDCEFSG